MSCWTWASEDDAPVKALAKINRKRKPHTNKLTSISAAAFFLPWAAKTRPAIIPIKGLKYL
jgi:hypothetical protein